MPKACIVSDLRMPGLASRSLQGELAAKGIVMPVIIVTAEENPEMRRQAKKAGAVAYFRKPVDGTALLDTIVLATGN